MRHNVLTNPLSGPLYSKGVQLLASLGHSGRRRAVLGHTLNTHTLMKTKISHHVLSKFTTLCWAAFIAILGRMQPAGRGLDTPARGYSSFLWVTQYTLYQNPFLMFTDSPTQWGRNSIPSENLEIIRTFPGSLAARVQAHAQGFANEMNLPQLGIGS